MTNNGRKMVIFEVWYNLLCIRRYESNFYFQIQYGGTNFTAFRMIDTNKMEIQSVIKGIVTKEMNNGRTLDTAIKVSFLGGYQFQTPFEEAFQLFIDFYFGQIH